jgi:hypothetical protein
MRYHSQVQLFQVYLSLDFQLLKSGGQCGKNIGIGKTGCRATRTGR